MTLAKLDRWKASAIHLGLSAAIGAAVVTLMLVLWYPQPYFAAMGGDTLILLLIGVDVVIGPLITYLGAFPVSMEVGGTLKAMKEALRALRDGAALTVFPEGECEFAGGETLPFKTGAVRLALQTDVPILPVTVSGGNRIWPQKQKYPQLFRRVIITYHPLLTITADDTLELHENFEIWTNKLKETITANWLARP